MPDRSIPNSSAFLCRPLKLNFTRIPQTYLELVPKLSFKRIQMPLQIPRGTDLDIRPIQSSLIYDKFSRHSLQADESHHIMKIARFWRVLGHAEGPQASDSESPVP